MLVIFRRGQFNKGTLSTKVVPGWSRRASSPYVNTRFAIVPQKTFSVVPLRSTLSIKQLALHRQVPGVFFEKGLSPKPFLNPKTLNQVRGVFSRGVAARPGSR